MSRAQRHQQTAQAARRLSGVATRSADAAVPVGPPPWERWRDTVADRVPLPLRAAARVPVAAAAAVLLVALAVVAGAMLRSASAGAQVVPIGRPPALSPAPSAVPSVASAGTPPAVPGAGASAAGPTGALSAAAVSGGPAGAVVVDVVGKVRRPGLVRLPPGSRVADAVAAAGGATDDAVLSRINLARLLGDGEQVLVPDRDDALPPVAAPAPSAGGGVASPGAPSGPLDLNAATAADLDGLPGIGPVLAGRIIAWRTEHGRYAAVDELAEVAGIGPTLLERLRPLVRV